MVFEKVRDLVVQQVGCNPEDVTLESSFIDDLGCDSLDVVEIIMALEDAYDIEIPDDDARNCLTVGEAVEYIQAHM
jgi:acyl carrier protein